MKKLALTTLVVALFAVGFTASSGGGDDEMVYQGVKYHKVIAVCHNCGTKVPEHSYWKDDHGNRLDEPQGNMIRGRYFCHECLSHPDRINKW